nr:MAG TPA: hypothetical protein [Caudoviricetes sp.]
MKPQQHASNGNRPQRCRFESYNLLIVKCNYYHTTTETYFNFI